MWHYCNCNYHSPHLRNESGTIPYSLGPDRVSDPNPDSIRSLTRIRIRNPDPGSRIKITHKNGKQLRKFKFLSAGCFLFFSCTLFSTFGHQNPRSGFVCGARSILSNWTRIRNTRFWAYHYRKVPKHRICTNLKLVLYYYLSRMTTDGKRPGNQRKGHTNIRCTVPVPILHYFKF